MVRLSLTFAKVVQVFDSWAGELSPTSFNEFALPYLKHIAEKLPTLLKQLGCGRVPMIVFAKGAWYALETLCQTDYDVIGLDWLHDPVEAFQIAQGYGKTIQGNADPGILYGDKKNISDVVHRMVTASKGGKQGWIANLGHGTVYFSKHKITVNTKRYTGVTPFVNPDMLKYFFEEIHRQTAA